MDKARGVFLFLSRISLLLVLFGPIPAGAADDVVLPNENLVADGLPPIRRVEYGDERDPKIRETLLAMSPLTNAGRITKPIFIVQGRNDPRVPYTEAEQMVAAIKKNGGPVWYLLAKDEGHGFSKKKNQDFQFLATLKFVEGQLLK